VLQAQGQLAKALAEYQAAKQIMQRLHERDPENTDWQSDLSVSHNNVGSVLQAQGQLAKALAEYQSDEEIMQRLHERDPENTDWQRDLSNVALVCGECAASAGRLGGGDGEIRKLDLRLLND